MKLIDNKFYGLRKSIVFYFYQDPKKDIIKELINDFVDFVNPSYSSYRYLTHDLKNINGKWHELFNSIIDKHDFDNVCTLSFTDSNKNQLQKNSVNFLIRNIKKEFPNKTPNIIYFEFEENISWEEIYHFISHSFYSLTYYYVSAGYSLAVNDYLYPKSTSLSVKELQRSKILNSLHSTWRNSSFLVNLKNGIDGPNIIQALCKELYHKLGFNTINDANKQNILNYHVGEDYIIINLPETFDLQEAYDDKQIYNIEFNGELIEKYKNLNKFLEPILVQFSKPQMFWKEEEWLLWQSRF
ncbi:hypothetical protein OD917_00285 [Flavobacterium sp. SH_e]|uniref:hypothetical protein n=1 Tax=Flavobacterium sp. SH_e TaxID=2983767 RepID=UPI0021E44E85|nr:hypothetical protein [Flavobacterium sp. SH_e]MCV2483343.1 hypothetical protein [Flavobacterium sp. SH_e]